MKNLFLLTNLVLIFLISISNTNASLLQVPKEIREKLDKELKIEKLYGGILYYVCKGLDETARNHLPRGNRGHGKLERCKWENPNNPIDGISYKMSITHSHVWKKFGQTIHVYGLQVDSRGVLQIDPDFLGRHNICVKSPVGRICVSTLQLGYLKSIRSLFTKIQKLK